VIAEHFYDLCRKNVNSYFCQDLLIRNASFLGIYVAQSKKNERINLTLNLSLIAMNEPQERTFSLFIFVCIG